MKPEERIPEEDCRARLFAVLNVIKRDVPIEHEIQYPIKDGSKRIYADLVVWNNERKPFLVIEVKRPELGRGNLLNNKTYEQALNYAKLLDVPYFILTDCSFTLIFLRDDTLAKPIRHYFSIGEINENFWKKIIKSLVEENPTDLPDSNKLDSNAERNLIGIARHVSWKILASESKSLKVDNTQLNKKTEEVYNSWMREMFGRNIVKNMR